MATIPKPDIFENLLNLKSVASTADEIESGLKGLESIIGAPQLKIIQDGLKGALASTDSSKALKQWYTDTVKALPAGPERDVLTSKTFKDGIQLLNRTNLFNIEIEKMMTRGEKIDLDAVKTKYSLDTLDPKLISPTVTRAERMVTVYENRAAQHAADTGVSIDDARAELGRRLLVANSAKKPEDLVRTSDSPATRDAAAAAGKPGWDAAHAKHVLEEAEKARRTAPPVTASDGWWDRLKGKFSSKREAHTDVEAPSGLVMPNLESGTNWKAYLYKLSPSAFSGFIHLRSIRSIPTKAAPILDEINDFVDKSMNKSKLVGSVRKLEMELDEAAKRTISDRDRPAVFAEIEGKMAAFAKDNKANLEAFGKDLDAYIKHLRGELVNVTIDGNDGRKIALVHKVDGTGNVLFSQVDPVLEGLEKLRGMVDDLQQDDFGKLGERFRKAKASTDPKFIQNEIANTLTLLTDYVRGAEIRLRFANESILDNTGAAAPPPPGKLLHQNALALRRAQEEGYYNPYSRKTKSSDTNVEHTWLKIDHFFESRIDKDGNIKWDQQSSQGFANLLLQMYERGMDQEALFELSNLKLRRGFTGQSKYPEDLGTYLLGNVGNAYKGDPHYEFWAKTMASRANVSDSGAARVFWPWNPGREAEQFYAEKDIVVRNAFRYTNDGWISKPGLINARNHVLSPLLSRVYHTWGAKDVIVNMDENAIIRVKPDWGKDAKDKPLAWYSPSVWARRTHTIPTLGTTASAEAAWNTSKVLTMGLTSKSSLKLAAVGGSIWGAGALADAATDDEYDFSRVGRGAIKAQIAGATWVADTVYNDLPTAVTSFFGANNGKGYSLTSLVPGENRDVYQDISHSVWAFGSNSSNSSAADSPASSPSSAASAVDPSQLEVTAMENLKFEKLEDIKTAADAKLESAGRPKEDGFLGKDAIIGNVTRGDQLTESVSAAIKALAARETAINEAINSYKGTDEAKYKAMLLLKEQLGEALKAFKTNTQTEIPELEEIVGASNAAVKALGAKIQGTDNPDIARNLLSLQRTQLLKIETARLHVLDTINTFDAAVKSGQAIAETPEAAKARADAKKKADADLANIATIDAARTRSQQNVETGKKTTDAINKNITELEGIAVSIADRIKILEPRAANDEAAKKELEHLQALQIKHKEVLEKIVANAQTEAKELQEKLVDMNAKIVAIHGQLASMENNESLLLSAQKHVQDQNAELAKMQAAGKNVENELNAFKASFKNGTAYAAPAEVKPAAPPPAPVAGDQQQRRVNPDGTPAPVNTPPAGTPDSPRAPAGTEFPKKSGTLNLGYIAGGYGLKSITRDYDDVARNLEKVQAWHLDGKQYNGGTAAMDQILAQAQQLEAKTAAALKEAREAEAAARKANEELQATTLQENTARATELAKIIQDQAIRVQNATKQAAESREAMKGLLERHPDIEEVAGRIIRNQGFKSVAEFGDGAKHGLLHNLLGDDSRGDSMLTRGFNAVADGVSGFQSWWDKVGRSAKTKGQQTAYMGATALGIVFMGLTAWNFGSGIFSKMTGINLDNGWIKALVIGGAALFALNKTGAIGESFAARDERNREDNINRNRTQYGGAAGPSHLPAGSADGTGTGTTFRVSRTDGTTDSASADTLVAAVNSPALTQDANGGLPGSSVINLAAARDQRLAAKAQGDGTQTVRVPGVERVEMMGDQMAGEARGATFRGDILVAANSNRYAAAAGAEIAG